MRIIVEITFGQFNSNVHFGKSTINERRRGAKGLLWIQIANLFRKTSGNSLQSPYFISFLHFFNPSSKLYSIFVEVTIRLQYDPFSKLFPESNNVSNRYRLQAFWSERLVCFPKARGWVVNQAPPPLPILYGLVVSY